MTEQTTPAKPLDTLTDDELRDIYCTTDDDGIRAAIENIAARRDQAERKHAKDAARWQSTYAAWHEFAHAQYLAAEAATNGYLLNREGVKAGIDPWTLWTGADSKITRYASEELREFFDHSPRMTVSEYHRQVRAERRAAREAAEGE